MPMMSRPWRLRPPGRWAWVLLFALSATLSLPACSDPCVELEVRICDVLGEKRRCELMQEEWRRELLTRDTCQSILDKLNRR